AEDGIRDRNVTGVQTCALPIYSHEGSINKRDAIQEKKENPPGCAIAMKVSDDSFVYVMVTRMNGTPSDSCELITNLAEKVEPMLPDGEIGRASCRERV